MKKIISRKEEVFYSSAGVFTIQELSKLVEPTDIVSVELNGWELTLYKYIQREETDEEHERRLLQEQYSEDWNKYQELKLKFNIK